MRNFKILCLSPGKPQLIGSFIGSCYQGWTSFSVFSPHREFVGNGDALALAAEDRKGHW